MLSEDIIELLSPYMTKTDIDLLHKKLIETVAIREGMFPVSECNIYIHMLVDLARYMKLAGNIKGWWAFAGERSFSTIKKYLPRGGSKLENTCFERYCKNEEIVTDNCYKFDIVDSINMFSRNEDIYLKPNLKRQDQFHHFFVLKKDPTNNQQQQQQQQNNNNNNNNNNSIYELKYTDFGFLLQKKIFDLSNLSYVNFYGQEGSVHDSIFSMYEINLLLEDLILEIKWICNYNENCMIQNSSLYRIYHSYKLHQSQVTSRNKISFYTWMHQCFINEIDYLAIANTELTANDNKTLIEAMDLRFTLMRVLYKTAIIYGKKFSSRGVIHKETFEIDRYANKYYYNDSNNLINNWGDDSRSTWFKCIKTYNQASVSEIRAMELYGQFNFFFTVPITNDQVVSNLLYGSAFFRGFKSAENLDTIDANDLSTPNHFYPKIRFIHLTHVYSTVFLVSAKDADGKPISKNRTSLLNKLQLIPLYPSRMKVSISTTVANNELFFNQEKKKIYFRYEN
jgi:hypothetical protein